MSLVINGNIVTKKFLFMGDESQNAAEKQQEFRELPRMHVVKAFNTVLWSSGRNVTRVPSTEHYLDTAANATSKNHQ